MQSVNYLKQYNLIRIQNKCIKEEHKYIEGQVKVVRQKQTKDNINK